MSTPDEERIAKEKASLDAMRNARANMADAISRIETLEKHLAAACSFIDGMKRYVPKDAYGYQSTKTLHDTITENVQSLRRVL